MHLHGSINAYLSVFSGTPCEVNGSSCGPTSLISCSSTCQCRENFPPVTLFGSSYCADSLNGSNCQIFPSRCVTWCNSTSNDLCICPTGTLKIQRNGFFICELPVNALNCSINDPIYRCPFGQCCSSGRCLDCSSTVSTTVSGTTGGNNDSDK